MNDPLALLAVIAVTALAAAWWRALDGKAHVKADEIGLEPLRAAGAPTGAWLLLELTAPHCATCLRARRVLDEVVQRSPDVAVHAVDIADAGDIARSQRVLRAPTVLLVDPGGVVRARVAGVPSASDLTRMLEQRGSLPMAS